jgi:hypothetical protein
MQSSTASYHVPRFMSKYSEIYFYQASSIIQVFLEKFKFDQFFTKFPTLWNKKLRYRAHRSSSLIHFQIQFKPVHTLTRYSIKSNVNIILPSMTKSSKWSLTLAFSDSNAVTKFTCPMCQMCSEWKKCYVDATLYLAGITDLYSNINLYTMNVGEREEVLLTAYWNLGICILIRGTYKTEFFLGFSSTGLVILRLQWQ